MSQPNLATIDAAELEGVTGGRSPAADEALKQFATQLTSTITEVQLGQQQQSTAVKDMVMQRLMGSAGGLGGLPR